ncbi:hypothetical protein Mal15_23870 [Stieleria maiorica]|uniref:Carboxypeptidase regulatory-like domain-containing protein n=2 Tax=Stieleria maiorica TaxID=2795974 RepID=A0A5B9MFI7_9BACT|nr:hypothetical protein Mal15_23870 [Stieleria maiorica]
MQRMNERTIETIKKRMTMKLHQRSLRPLGWLAAILVLAVLQTGCDSSPKLGQVTGVLTMDGEPVKNGSIEFVPSGGGRPSLALTDAEGRYTAYYLPNVPGALPGKHRIRFEIAKAKPGDPGLVRPKGKGRPTGEVTLEPSTIEVVAGENQVDFKLVEAQS